MVRLYGGERLFAPVPYGHWMILVSFVRDGLLASS